MALIAAALFEYSPAATITVTFGIINVIPALSTVTNTLETRIMAPDSLNNYITIATTNIYGNYLFSII